MPTELVVGSGSPGALERLERRFDIARSEVSLGEHRLVLPELVDPVSYIEERASVAGQSLADLPYWTKIWPASVYLANFVRARPDLISDPVLELGAGLALPGLIAAQNGSRVVLSDLDDDALEFARAAVELNGLEDRVEILALDWKQPPPQLGTFATILGAEILYQEPLYPSLVHLLARALDRDGTAFIAHQERPFGLSFFRLAAASFRFKSTSSTLKERNAENEPTRVYVHALKKL